MTGLASSMPGITAMSGRRRMATSMVAIGAIMLVAACTTDDPNKGGFFGGLIGIGSGAYRDRIATEETALAAEETRYRDEVDGQARLDRSVNERRAEAAELGDRLTSLRAEVDELDAEIAALQDEESLTVGQVERAEANVATLLDDIDRIEAEREAHAQAEELGADAGPDADPAAFGEPPREEVSELRAYINKLQAAVDALKLARERRRAGEAGAVSVETVD